MSSRTVDFENIHQLLQHINDNLINKPHVYYRGMRSHDWTLSTTYLRFINEYRPDILNDKARKLPMGSDKRLLKKFSQNLIINNDFPNVNFDPETDNTELWELGQHFGLPSPLLDWSASPYVALFFALHEKLDVGKNPCIWTLDSVLLETLQQVFIDKGAQETEPDYAHKIYLINPSFEKNKRVAYQQGVFTRGVNLMPQEKLEDALRDKQGIKHGDYIFKQYTFTCTDEQRLSALLMLDKMNINYRTLYPDVEGSVKHAKLSLILESTHRRGASYSFSS